MEKLIKKSLINALEEQLARNLPLFKLKKDLALPQGWRCYGAALDGGLNAFLMLVTKSDENQFILEIAVSPSAYPPDSLRGGPSDPVEGGLYFRAHKLWQTGGREPWWCIQNESKEHTAKSKVLAAAGIAPSLNEKPLSVIMKELETVLKQYIAPYFLNIRR